MARIIADAPAGSRILRNREFKSADVAARAWLDAVRSVAVWVCKIAGLDVGNKINSCSVKNPKAESCDRGRAKEFGC